MRKIKYTRELPRASFEFTAQLRCKLLVKNHLFGEKKYIQGLQTSLFFDESGTDKAF
jgi:hypothetical protein